ncbi:MAG: GlsB/YeaQ/YmgE family stress response membrane protein [Thermoanaerobaculia bacterium]
MVPGMGLASWIAMGLLAGAVARYLTRGRNGCLTTVGVGVLGALAGGLLSTALGFGGLSGFDVRSFVIATLGAVLLLLVLRLLRPGA